MTKHEPPSAPGHMVNNKAKWHSLQQYVLVIQKYMCLSFSEFFIIGLGESCH